MLHTLLHNNCPRGGSITSSLFNIVRTYPRATEGVLKTLHALTSTGALALGAYGIHKAIQAKKQREQESKINKVGGELDPRLQRSIAGAPFAGVQGMEAQIRNPPPQIVINNQAPSKESKESKERRKKSSYGSLIGKALAGTAAVALPIALNYATGQYSPGRIMSSIMGSAIPGVAQSLLSGITSLMGSSNQKKSILGEVLEGDKPRATPSAQLPYRPSRRAKL